MWLDSDSESQADDRVILASRELLVGKTCLWWLFDWSAALIDVVFFGFWNSIDSKYLRLIKVLWSWGQASRKVSYVEFDQEVVSLKIYIEISSSCATSWHMRVAYGDGTE